MKISLTARVRHCIRGRPMTVAEVTAVVGRYITASQAARARQRCTVADGKRHLVGAILSRLRTRGDAIRVAQATYRAA